MTQIELICATCNNKFLRWKSKVRSNNAFCSFGCKNKGMSLGLTAPMRGGTGCDVKTQMLKRKYYKYKVKGITVWEFVEKLKSNVCTYCGSNENLGFDRIDNSKDHNLDNILICCHLCNMTRGNRYTVDEMKKIGGVIKQILDERKLK